MEKTTWTFIKEPWHFHDCFTYKFILIFLSLFSFKVFLVKTTQNILNLWKYVFQNYIEAYEIVFGDFVQF